MLIDQAASPLKAVLFDEAAATPSAGRVHHTDLL